MCYKYSQNIEKMEVIQEVENDDVYIDTSDFSDESDDSIIEENVVFNFPIIISSGEILNPLYKQMLDNPEELTDMSFMLNNGQIKICAHQCIVAAGSTHFAKVLKGKI